jgi:DNA-binding CsgD family transcriptional regulator
MTDIPWTACGAADEVAPVPMHGRRAEQEHLTQWVRRLVHRRSGGVLWIDGPAGIGKSRMLECAASEASVAGARVLTGAGVPSGDMTPLAPLLDALVSGAGHDIARRLRVPSHGHSDPYWLLQAVKDRLRALSGNQPLVLLLDDVHRCDELTLLSVRTLAVQLADAPLLWVLASRPHTDVPAVESLRRDLLADDATHMELAPLERAAVERMAQDLLGPYAASARPYLHYTDGLPGSVRQMCEHLKREPLATGDGSDGGKRTVIRPAVIPPASVRPAPIRQVITRRIDQLTDEGRELTLTASLLSTSFTVRHLSRVLGRPESALLRPLREVLSARLLRAGRDRLSFPHTAVRETVAAMLPRPVRLSVRRRSVDLRLKDGVSAVAVAAELAEIAEPGDARAVRVLRAAARELAAVSPGVAAGHLRRAVELTQDPSPERLRLSAELIPLLWQSGDVSAAQDMARRVIQAPPDPVTHAQACLQLARLGSQFRVPLPDAHVRRVHHRRDVPASLKDQLLSLTMLNQLMTGTVDEVGGIMADPLRRRRGAHVVSELTHRTSQSMSACHHQNWAAALKHADTAAARVMEVDPARGAALPEVALSICWRASLVSLAGDDRAALDLVDSGLAEAEQCGRRALLPLWRTARARLLLDTGHLAEATEELSAIEKALASAVTPSFAGEAAVLYTQVRTAFHTGDDAGMEACAAKAEAYLRSGDPHQRRVGAWTAVVTSCHDRRSELTERQCELAERQLLDAAAFLRRGFVHTMGLDPADVLFLVRAALDSGRRDLASSAVEFAEQRARRDPGFPLFEAAAVHARGLLEGTPDTLARAAELWGTVRPLLRASALGDSGRLLSAAGDPAGRTRIEQALELYEPCGAHGESRRVRNQLRKLGTQPAATENVPDAGWRGLTPAELGVVRLVARGATNREAAERLFLSPHTVNTHVRHAFEKLGIRSRVHLARLYTQEMDQPVELSH